MTDLQNPIFNDEEAARKHFEATRWPDGPYCPYCGQFERVAAFGGKSMGPGWYHCKDCRRKFTATMGTVCERSHIPMTKWLLAMHLLSASKKGMSAHQLHRMLGVTYKSAWFMAMRIREAMRKLSPESEPMGGEGKTVEMDETFVGGKAKNQHAKKRKHIGTGGAGKEAVFSLVERKGKVRSHHVPAVNAKTLRPILEAQIHKATYIMTDESSVYPKAAGAFAGHGTVNHGIEEYVRGGFWHTNTVEGYFSVFKRGIMGTYHSVSQKHLKRYLAEFDFRYNERAALGVDDTGRMVKALEGVVGKRLTYQISGATA